MMRRGPSPTLATFDASRANLALLAHAYRAPRTDTRTTTQRIADAARERETRRQKLPVRWWA